MLGIEISKIVNGKLVPTGESSLYVTANPKDKSITITEISLVNGNFTYFSLIQYILKATENITIRTNNKPNFFLSFILIQS